MAAPNGAAHGAVGGGDDLFEREQHIGLPRLVAQIDKVLRRVDLLEQTSPNLNTSAISPVAKLGLDEIVAVGTTGRCSIRP